ncbi:hypothetical protein DSM104329_03600 [Capillimicrobium parvum]|uniref:Uncharacterized protein n=1 Tax=Capillimicrobium parvum TaxID=2884022 RepID=A0A9E7C172_9ACTN|nr:hypothetical protein DSM104329_03600 [Capillimicrobium parvum]
MAANLKVRDRPLSATTWATGDVTRLWPLTHVRRDQVVEVTS